MGKKNIEDRSKFPLTKPFNAVEFVNEFFRGWTIWKGPLKGDGLSGQEDQDKRSLVLTEINLLSLAFEICLKTERRRAIEGEEKLLCLKKKRHLIRLGGNVFFNLLLDYEANKENSALEWLYWNRGISYLDFFGFVLRNPSGCRCVLCFYRCGGGTWEHECRWLDEKSYDSGDLTAVYKNSA